MGVYDVNGNSLTADGVAVNAYYENELASTVADVRAAQVEPCLTFGLVTDVHYASADTIIFPNTCTNMAAVARKVRMDGIFALGDMTDGDQTQAVTAGLVTTIMELLRNTGVPVFFSAGNHDTNYFASSGAYEYTNSQIYQYYYTHGANDVILDMDTHGVSFYKDFDGFKVRLVSLDSNSNGKYNYATTTRDWFVNTVLPSVPTGYTVLLISHMSCIKSHNWDSTGTSDATIKNAITSFINGGGTIVSLFGHSHVDYHVVTPWLEICTCSNKRGGASDVFYPDGGSAYPTDAWRWGRAYETATEDLWDVVVFMPTIKEIDMIRFGAGPNRYFHYDPIAPTTLTARLSSVTWASTDTSIATVSNGTVTGVASGTCAVTATDANHNFELWIIKVT